jgi:aminoglycoside 6'-N-acetyltransferase I
MSKIVVKLLGPGDGDVLLRVAPDVFDEPVDPILARTFLVEPGHSIAVAIADDVVVGFASGICYLHPDKPWAFWVNEVGVAPQWRRQGVGKAVLRCLLAGAAEAGCTEAWVGTEADNLPAQALYRALGGVVDSEAFITFTWHIDAFAGDDEALRPF